eukprot:TRINITY_DN5298_c0_g1_i1.p1 TRINITY_DN5298_c0_g1~~TRINITY_DN5298_c0_g1_i1.p1  ORF type:complete len:359 (-),score=101.76 TRINITY_DN5298_c0_g1_i1:367-1443(-)
MKETFWTQTNATNTLPPCRPMLLSLVEPAFSRILYRLNHNGISISPSGETLFNGSIIEQFDRSNLYPRGSHYYYRGNPSNFLSVVGAIPTGLLPALKRYIPRIFPEIHTTLYSDSVLYIPRYTTHLPIPMASNLEKDVGVIGSILFGHRFYISLSLSVFLPYNVHIDEIITSLNSALQTENSERYIHPYFLEFQVNFTLIIVPEFQDEFNLKNITKLGQNFTAALFEIDEWKSEISTKIRKIPAENSVAIGFSAYEADGKILKFHSSQCIVGSLPSLPLLFSLSNTLMIGALFGLITAVVMVACIGYACIGNVLERLTAMGRLSLPWFIRIVPYRIFIVQFWPFLPEDDPTQIHLHLD